MLRNLWCELVSLGNRVVLKFCVEGPLLKQNILNVYYNRKLHDPITTGVNVCQTSQIRVAAMSIVLVIGSYGLHK